MNGWFHYGWKMMFIYLFSQGFPALSNEISPLDPNADHGRVTADFTMAGWLEPNVKINLSSPSTTGLNAIKGQKFVVWPDPGHKLYGDGHSGAGLSVGVNGLMVVEHSSGYFSSVLTWESPITNRTYIAVVYRDGRPTLLVNGQRMMQGIASGRIVHPGTVQAGPRTARFAGKMDGWAIYDTALSDEQIQNLFAVPGTPSVFWADDAVPPKASYGNELRSPSAGDPFASAFQNPPDSTRPGVYWYWLRDNISREGITKDLEAMKRVGIGRAYIANVDATPIGRGKVKMFTDEWWDLTEHAIREGTRLGVDIGVFNGPGWSQSGGPWVKPEQSMRYLAVTETRVSGPKKFNGILPVPALRNNQYGYFKDVAMLAVPEQTDPAAAVLAESRVTTSVSADGAALMDGDLSTVCTFPAGAARGKPFVVDIQCPEKVTVQNITVVPARVQMKVDCELQYRDSQGAWQTVKKFNWVRLEKLNVGPMRFAPVVEAFSPVEAKDFRLVFTGLAGGSTTRPPGIAEIELSGIPKLERYVEKQLGQMFPTPHAPWDAYLWDRSPGAEEHSFLQPAQVLNISEKLDASGHLVWDVPSGNWTVMRIGMASTQVRNNSAPREGQGLEVDKLNSEWVRSYFSAYLGKLISKLSPEERAGWKYVVMDSYEKGSQNWTDDFRDEFRNRYGYDPVPWLPVLSGMVVGSPDQSDRFLWDWRRLVADGVASNYVGTICDEAHRNGLKVWMENYGHFGFPGEDLQYGSLADEVAGEFWATGGLGSFEVKIAASSSHIYGKPVVSAESFTTGGSAWTQTPWSLKQRGDWAMAEGVNQYILHLFIHQSVDRVPGINAWFGTEFNRNNTWFDYMGGWIRSFRRTQAVLQQGTFVADLLYFTGEDAPKETGICDPPLPEGYNYDFINGEVLRTRLQVKDGRFVLPDGTSYRLLVLPPLQTMRPGLLEKISTLIEQGGALLGEPPCRSPSLEDFPACDDRVSSLAARLWKGIDGKSVTTGSYGKGFVFRGVGADAALKALGVLPDVEGIGERPGFGANQGFTWIHRQSEDADVYFLSNQSDDHKMVSFTFRVNEGVPELWDPVSGDMRALPRFTRKKGRVQVPLKFLPRQSYLIAFRRTGALPVTGTADFLSFKPVKNLNSEWKVFFDPAFAGSGTVCFDHLADWTENMDDRIKYYSGTAVYRTAFDFNGSVSGRFFLNLGEYNSIARVQLNGQKLGVVWTKPGRLEISGALKTGENKLEICVANNWNNRLLGDSKLPEEKRVTWINIDAGIKPHTQLQPSGLIGPVMIERSDE